MLKPIQEFGKYVEITGFDKVKIGGATEFLETIRKERPSDVEAQFFDATLIATWQHLYFAALNALTAFKNAENMSKTLAMETLLYATAERQITKAMEIIGIKPNSSEVAVLIIGKKPETTQATLLLISKKIGRRPNEKVLELSKEKAAAIRKTFQISDVELTTVVRNDDLEKALVDLVIEKMALLATQR